MSQSNRLLKLVKATSKFPKGIRSTLWSKAFSIVPMVGTANIRYLEVDVNHVTVRLENQKICRTILKVSMLRLWRFWQKLQQVF